MYEERSLKQKFGVAATIGGGITAGLFGIYSLSALWVADGSEFKYVRNAGEVKNVATQGIGFAYHILDRVDSLPRTKQITNVSSENANLRSELGEKFEGKIRIEYRFDLGETEEAQSQAIEGLIARFGISIAKDIEKSLDSAKGYQDAIEKVVQARAQTISVSILNDYATDDFQDKANEIGNKIHEQLQAQLRGEEGLPITIDKIDNSGLAPGKEAQERIERIAAEQREGDRAQVVINNAQKIQEAAVQEAETFLKFAAPLIDAGFDEETVVSINCQRLADKADRFGIPFGANCQGSYQNFGHGDDVSIAVNPQKYVPDMPTP